MMNSFKKLISKNSWEFLLGCLLVLAVICASFMSPYYLNFDQIVRSLASSIVTQGILALAFMLLILVGEMDLSLPAILSVGTVTLGFLSERGVPIYVALVIVTIIGAILGSFNGWIITKFKLPSMAVTIGMMDVYRSLALVIGGEKGFGRSSFTPEYLWLGTTKLFGRLPVSLVLLVVLFIVFILIMKETVFGRLVYSMGNNVEATRLSGHNTFFSKIKLFCYAGAIAGLTSFQYVGQYQSAKADNASTMLLFVVACVVLGGVDINGGKGSVVGVALSILFIGTVQNILGLRNVQGQVQTLIIGLIMIISISLPIIVRVIKEKRLQSDTLKRSAETGAEIQAKRDKEAEGNKSENTSLNGEDYLLLLDGVSKNYGGIHALKDVTFGVKRGEIHAICGENGAGKSTLIKTISGLIQPDEGTIYLNNTPVVFKTPMEARESGVVAMYQDPQLFLTLNVVENIFMGVEPKTKLGAINHAKAAKTAKELFASLGMKNDVDSLVAGLTIAEMEFVQFARSFVGEEKSLYILDEPTASLTPSETKVLFNFLKELRDKGKSVIIITHRLEDLEGLADTVTIMRDGQHIITKPKDEMTTSEIIKYMVGRSFEYTPKAKKADIGNSTEVLSVKNFSKLGVFDNINFSVKSGEIVGITGLVGAGRSEICEAIFGVTQESSGQVFLDGIEMKHRTPEKMVKAGLAFLPEDRDNKGCIVEMPVRDNIILSIIKKLARKGIRNEAAENEVAQIYRDKLSIKVAGLDAPVKSLSGGNRQKVVLSKWIATEPKVIILDEPTHGIDIAVKDQVHQIINQMAEDGIGIVVISSDLPEVISVSDRILVIAEGELVASFDAESVTQEQIMEASILKRNKSDAS